ncbi:MAG: SMP-30/gluconolactonase/LRE family protein [Bryobacteraceae bacterium]|nr:SMP-30/gluconolactonase/LRE family protein [Bryobacteraceae bacterium]
MTRLIALCWLAAVVPAQEYPLGLDSQRQAGVPAGTVTKHTWSSRIFPGTQRDYWIYVPAQYKQGTAAAVMIFQDGAGMVNEQGRFRVPIVFDNLIHKKEMPVTIGIFINPGVLPARGENQQARYNRSFEYDALGDRYARFLIEEMLPEVGRRYTLTTDANLRALAGSSSGGIAAFNAAWERPDQFRRVLSFVGSYVNLRGAQILPSLIRKTEPKPLRVFLQDGNRDQNIYAGNWWIANQDMASALQYAGYETTFVTGTEGHNSIHGSSILPDALRWLWKGHGTPVSASRAGGDRHFITSILDPGGDWQLVSEGHGFTEGPAVDTQGNVFFTDIPNNRIHKIAVDGSVSVFKEDTGGANGLMFGPDGLLYACQNRRKRIVAYAMDGTEKVIAEDVNSNDLTITQKGEIYFSDPPGKRVWFIDASRNKRVVHEGGIEFPNGVALSPDQSLLMVADYRGKWVWSFQIEPGGSLSHGQAFYGLETGDESDDSYADGMKTDSEGHLWVTTRAGIQVCDQPGRVVGIISKPHAGAVSNLVFAGPDRDWIYVTGGDKVFKRHVRRKGVSILTPVKPPQPRL